MRRVFRTSLVLVSLMLVACQGASSDDGATSADALETTSIVRTQTTAAGADVTYGFRDSSFDYGTGPEDWKATSFCWNGSPLGVCGEIERAFGAMQLAYGQGAHDTAELASCAVEGDVVHAAYNLSDDYGGDLDVTRAIGPCAR